MTPDAITAAADDAFSAKPGAPIAAARLEEIRRLVGSPARTEGGNAA